MTTSPTALTLRHLRNNDIVHIDVPIPAPLMNMNSRNHWRIDRQHAKAWRQATSLAAINTLGSPRNRRRPPCTIKITLPVRDNRRRDPHNYFPTVKHIIDGLVDAGCWPDDTPDWVTTTEPVLSSTARMVHITLTPRSNT